MESTIMETTTLTLHDGRQIINETLIPGKTLLDQIHRIPSVNIDAPCGGKGTCGKCRVRILEGKVSSPGPEELKLLSEKELSDGIRLACKTIAEGPVTVSLDHGDGTAKIKTSGSLQYKGELKPLFRKELVSLPPGDINDQRSMESRLMAALPPTTHLPHMLRHQLAVLQREQCYDLTLTLCGDQLSAIHPGHDASPLYALAVDIGTTTVVAYLINLENGELLGNASALNAQKAFGADVISRIEYIGDDAEKLKSLQIRILGQIESLCTRVLNEHKVGMEVLAGIFAAGNTTMMHILQGISPRTIAEAPFLPVSTESMILTPEELGSELPAHIRFVMLPSLSGYIGADIVAGILASQMAESEDLSLLVDIGTNGEIALGNRDKLVSCSTAAGPAFEGANIQCGSAGVPGALSVFRKDGDGVLWETIEGLPATGICGSGIIDMTAFLLRTGLADYTGRFQDDSNWGENPPVESRLLRDTDGDLRVVWDDKNENIFFSQKDLREVQLAKGSIAAGIHTLIKEAGFEMDDIKHVYLAGGFGSYIDKESALAIGLIPPELRGKIESVGNSCGAGVIRCAMNSDELMRCETIREKTEYIELSSHPGFQEEYMMQMYFPIDD